MELEQAKKRVEELRAVIEKNNRLYYDQDAPELEDFEYDPARRRHPQRTLRKSDTCRQDGKFAGCIFLR